MSNIQQLKSGVSILLKKTPKGKINPNKIGYVLPDGKINFATSEAAETYAKNRVVEALNGPKPFERGIIYKDNLIISESNGGKAKVEFNKDLCGNIKDCIVVHGHPRINGGDSPVSLTDYLMMESQQLKKMTAYNKDGEYSSLTKEKTKSFIIKLLPKKIQEKLKVLETIGNSSYATEHYAKTQLELYTQKYQTYQKVAEAALHANVGIPYADSNKVKFFNQIKGTPILKETLDAEKSIGIEKAQQKVHEFWQKTAQKLDCKYDTNFSQFKQN